MFVEESTLLFSSFEFRDFLFEFLDGVFGNQGRNLTLSTGETFVFFVDCFFTIDFEKCFEILGEL